MAKSILEYTEEEAQQAYWNLIAAGNLGKKNKMISQNIEQEDRNTYRWMGITSAGLIGIILNVLIQIPTIAQDKEDMKWLAIISVILLLISTFTGVWYESFNARALYWSNSEKAHALLEGQPRYKHIARLNKAGKTLAKILTPMLLVCGFLIFLIYFFTQLYNF